MICPICNRPITCNVTLFNEIPFIDGQKYESMCFICASTPNTYEYHEESEILHIYKNYSPYHINTIDHMLSQGWTKEECETSIKAVKKLANAIEIAESIIYESLYLLEEGIQAPVEPIPPSPLVVSSTSPSDINT